MLQGFCFLRPAGRRYLKVKVFYEPGMWKHQLNGKFRDADLWMKEVEGKTLALPYLGPFLQMLNIIKIL